MMPKKRKGEPCVVFNIHSIAKHQKIQGGPLVNFFFEKSPTMLKNL